MRNPKFKGFLERKRFEVKFEIRLANWWCRERRTRRNGNAGGTAKHFGRAYVTGKSDSGSPKASGTDELIKEMLMLLTKPIMEEIRCHDSLCCQRADRDIRKFTREVV